MNTLIATLKKCKRCRSLYAYGNHIRVCGVEMDLSTCDSGVTVTFLQYCCSSSSDMFMRTTNIEYVCEPKLGAHMYF